jgi:alpha-L-rhamnosidase
VPANSKALVKLPAIDANKLNQIAQTQRIKVVEGALEVGSGEYVFEW